MIKEGLGLSIFPVGSMIRNLTDIASSEAILASVAIPLGTVNTVANFFISIGIK